MIPSSVLAVVAFILGLLSLADAYTVRKRSIFTMAQRLINAGLFVWIGVLYGYKISGEPAADVVALMRQILLVLCVLHGLEIVTRWHPSGIAKLFQRIRSKQKHDL